MSRDNTPVKPPEALAPVAPEEPTPTPEVSKRGNLTVTFAYELTTADGKARKPDSSAAIPAAEALQLVHAGLARFEKE